MKKIVAILMTLVVGISCLSVARATEPAIDLYVGAINGIERKLYNQGKATYLKIGEKTEKIGPNF